MLSTSEVGISGLRPDGVAQFGQDASLLVEFFPGKKPNATKSREAGITIYDPVDMIRIIQPGEKDVMEYEADRGWPPYKVRFARQWAAYQTGMEQRKAGTPLDMLYPAQPDVVATLQAMHVYTVQQLAGLSDTAMGNLPMGRSLVKTAKEYLGQASGSAEFHALKAENATLQSDLKAVMARIEAMEKASTTKKKEVA